MEDKPHAGHLSAEKKKSTGVAARAQKKPFRR
jgi:hypothetical protein